LKKLKADSKDNNVNVLMNASYTSSDFKDGFSQFWKEDLKADILKDSPATLITEPFRCCQLNDFVSDAGFLDALKDELLELDFIEKNNDLYKFQQTADLGGVERPHVRALRRLLFGQLRDWLCEVTGIALEDTVDMGCSRYQYTDTLLCHDDELEGRRIAFVLYLVPAWSRQDGGLLDLFDRDEHGQPRQVSRSILPANNSLVLFEVTPESFHQVSEVLSEDKLRLSVNGWFHGPGVPRPPRHVEPREKAIVPGHVEEETVYAWVNPLYLADETQQSIRVQFEEDSEIQLQDFLLPDKYAAVSDALRKHNEWELRGPANRRRSERGRALPPLVEELVTLMQSEAIFLVLSQLTGLVFHPLAEAAGEVEEGVQNGDSAGGSGAQNGDSAGSSGAQESSEDESSEEEDDGPKDGSSARCRLEVRRWRPSLYTLVHDEDASQRERALDARLCLSADDWEDQLGGVTSYIARGEDTELLSVSPESNALSLVYRDRGTVRFVKHINSGARHRPVFHDIAASYYE